MSTRESKRKKTSQAVDTPDDHSKHELFTKWSEDRGVEINGVNAAKLNGRGLGLVATKHIKEGERLLFIPPKAMFRWDSGWLRRHGLHQVSPQAKLAISALTAFGQMAVWQETWPTSLDFAESMPICCSEEVKRLLPPGVHQPLERQLADYQRDWSAVSKVCRDQHYREAEFKYYWLIVNSRSFMWKPPGDKAGEMVMCPFIDYLNHGPTGGSCNVSQSDKGYKVTADRDYVHYGFVLPNSPNIDDDIRLDHLIIPKLDEQIRTQLQDVGFLGAYALLPASNELCFKTQVAVRAVLLTCNEWEYFAESGEDLSGDTTPAVNEWVKDLLRKYRSEAVAKLEEVDQLEDGTPKNLLHLRWTQIVDGVGAFVEA